MESFENHYKHLVFSPTSLARLLFWLHAKCFADKLPLSTLRELGPSRRQNCVDHVSGRLSFPSFLEHSEFLNYDPFYPEKLSVHRGGFKNESQTARVRPIMGPRALSQMCEPPLPHGKARSSTSPPTHTHTVLSQSQAGLGY